MSDLLTGPIKDFYTIGSDIWDRYHKWKDTVYSENVLVNLFYIECKYNLTILDALKLNGFNNENSNEDLIHFIQLIKVDQLERILFSGLAINDKAKIEENKKSFFSFISEPIKILFFVLCVNKTTFSIDSLVGNSD